MAESFLSEIAGNVVGKIGSFALKEVGLAWGLETELNKIKDKLIAIEAVILDAEQQQRQSKGAKLWVEKLTRVLYDAEDVLDEFDYVALRKQVVNKVSRFFSTSNPFVFRFEMGHKLKNIRERLAEIADLRSELGLTERVSERHVIGREREMTHSFVDAAKVIGRDGDKEIILGKLEQCGDGEDLSVIPIVGMGGLGKTTLAKLVYNDPKVDGHFSTKLWVCISNDFDLQKVIIKILKSADKTCKDMDLDQLQRALRGTLEGKKYLLVMDDVWCEDRRKWLELSDLLVGGGKGSKILVTTRSKKVAAIMGTVHSHNLGDLSPEDGLSLFSRCAFQQGEEHQYPNLRIIGKEIVGKCKGVPLAIISLGSLLYSTTDQSDWEFVKNSEIWDLEEKENGILPALRLSYEQLPSYLKRCFAYCSLFPEDFVFNSVSLTQFWMAHGLLRSSNPGEELEDVGMRYLKELWLKGFFQDVEVGLHSIRCKMHDLVHDLALWVAQNEYFLITSADQLFPKNVQRWPFIKLNSVDEDNLFASSANMKMARTIFLKDVDAGKRISIMETCFPGPEKRIRAIDPFPCFFKILPRSIGSWKHLRYLNLEPRFGGELPESICELLNLQTLILQNCFQLSKLPRDIKYLINLRYLALTISGKRLPNDGIGCLKSLRTLILHDCRYLEYLMEDMGGLINLRNLFISNCYELISFPRSMKYLSRLEFVDISCCYNLDLTMEEEEDSQLNIRKLFFVGLPKLVELPQWLFPPSSKNLEILALVECCNLKQLPMWLQHKTAMRFLRILLCRLLNERCKPDEGEDWHKIAHIPEISVDLEDIKHQPSITASQKYMEPVDKFDILRWEFDQRIFERSTLDQLFRGLWYLPTLSSDSV